MSSCFLSVIDVRLTSCPSLYWVIVEGLEDFAEPFWTYVENWATRLMMLLNMNYDINQLRTFLELPQNYLKCKTF